MVLYIDDFGKSRVKVSPSMKGFRDYVLTPDVIMKFEKCASHYDSNRYQPLERASTSHQSYSTSSQVCAPESGQSRQSEGATILKTEEELGYVQEVLAPEGSRI